MLQEDLTGKILHKPWMMTLILPGEWQLFLRLLKRETGYWMKMSLIFQVKRLKK